ncbi:hypothetical protein [Paraburkholderia caribensis]|uniref:hypothetical protein n=1 Tax=Paraburkholderia caribensis TaxID=75105 RepID=UPI0015904A99|nr:hypothetical protein [Paraburkholderia caribensis]
MATAQETTPGSQDLFTFQSVVQQQEGIFGPLVSLSISGSGTNNVMTFQVGVSPDADHRVTLQSYDIHPPQLAGTRLVCIATCLVAGKAQNVAAYRNVD